MVPQIHDFTLIFTQLWTNLKQKIMKELIKKWENKLLLVQSDILDGKCPNLEMQYYKNGEQSVILELLNDLRKFEKEPC